MEFLINRVGVISICGWAISLKGKNYVGQLL